MPKRLIVNADDFGQSSAINRGIIRAHEEGIVTATSLMVRWPAAGEAVDYALSHPSLCLGIHIDLGEWAYRDGQWVAVYKVVPPGDATAVGEEIRRQIARFAEMVGRNPTHIDSHQHVHTREPAMSILRPIAAEMGVHLRKFGQAQYCGEFYGQTTEGWAYHEALTVENLLRIFRSLPEGTTELCCHPGDLDESLQTTYRTERTKERDVLCEARVRAAIGELGIELTRFR